MKKHICTRFQLSAPDADTGEREIECVECYQTFGQTAIVKMLNEQQSAVAAERERCAKIAESANVRHGITQAEIRTGDQVARSIAAAIRARNGAK